MPSTAPHTLGHPYEGGTVSLILQMSMLKLTDIK